MSFNLAKPRYAEISALSTNAQKCHTKCSMTYDSICALRIPESHITRLTSAIKILTWLCRRKVLRMPGEWLTTRLLMSKKARVHASMRSSVSHVHDGMHRNMF